jgi:hypothetical protein
MITNFKNHYWAIGGEDALVYSSARNVMVPETDVDYVNWLSSHQAPTPIANKAELAVVLKQSVPGLLPSWLEEIDDDFIQPAPGQYSPAQLTAYAAHVRYNTEVAGISLAGGKKVATDDRSKLMIMIARMSAEKDVTFTTPWVENDGSISTLNATQIIEMSDAVLDHVHKIFTDFNTAVEKISGGQATTLEKIDVEYKSKEVK